MRHCVYVVSFFPFDAFYLFINQQSFLLNLFDFIDVIDAQITIFELLKMLLGLIDLEFGDHVRIKSLILAYLLLVALKKPEILLKLILRGLQSLVRLSFNFELL